MSAAPALFGLLIVVPFIIGLVGMIVLFVMGRGGVTRPSCGACGYAVEGLDVLRCPECGADFRESGIRTPGMRRRFGPWIWALLWTMVLPLPALTLTLIGGGIIEQVSPPRHDNTMDVRLQPMRNDAFRFVDFRLAGTDVVGWNTYETLTLTPTRANGTTGPRLRAPLDGDGFEVEQADGTWRSDPGALDEAALAAWLTEASGRPADPEREVEAEVLRTIMTDVIGGRGVTTRGRGFNGGSVSSFSQVRAALWYPITAAVFWAVVWILGLIVIIRRTRRHRTDATPQPATA